MCYFKNVFCFGFTNDRFYTIFHFRYFFFFAPLGNSQNNFFDVQPERAFYFQ